MKANKAVSATVRDITGTGTPRNYQQQQHYGLTTTVGDMYPLTNDVGIQFNSKKEMQFVNRNFIISSRYEQNVRYVQTTPAPAPVPEQTASPAPRSTLDVGVGSAQKRVKRVYAPQTVDCGAGSDVTTYSMRGTTKDKWRWRERDGERGERPERREREEGERQRPTASKRVGGRPGRLPASRISTMCSPIQVRSVATSQRTTANVKDSQDVRSSAVERVAFPTQYTCRDACVQVRCHRETDATGTSTRVQNREHRDTSQKSNVSPAIDNNLNYKVNATMTYRPPRKRKNKIKINVSSDSILEKVYELDEPYDVHTGDARGDVTQNQRVVWEYRAICDLPSKPRTLEDNKALLKKSTSLIKRKYSALLKSLAKKQPEQTAESPSKKDAAVASDPPSLQSCSFNIEKASSLKKKRHYQISESHKQSSHTSEVSKTWPKNVYTDSECQHSIKSMLKVWKKIFDSEKPARKKSSDVTSAAPHNSQQTVGDAYSTEKVSKESKRKTRRLFFFRKTLNKIKSPLEVHKSKNEPMISNHCEISDGKAQVTPESPKTPSRNCSDNTNKSKPVENYEELVKATRLVKFRRNPVESRSSVRVRWSNRMYYASSNSTLFELMEDIYKESGLIVTSQSENTSQTSDSSSIYKSKGQFMQAFQAYMMPRLIRDSISLPHKSSNKPGGCQIKVSLSDLNWYIEKSKAFSNKIDVVLHKLYSHSLVKVRQKKASCLKIKLPKEFFDEESGRESKRHTTTDEEVSQVVDYELEASRNSTETKVSNSGDYKDETTDIIVKFQRDDIVTQGSDEYFVQKCDVGVLGVGLVPQKDKLRFGPHDFQICEHIDENGITNGRYKPTLNYNCGSGRKDYKNWKSSGADLFGRLASESHIQCCSAGCRSCRSPFRELAAMSCPNVNEGYDADCFNCKPSSNSEKMKNESVFKCSIEEFKSKCSKEEGKLFSTRVLPKDSRELLKYGKCKTQDKCKGFSQDKPYSVPSKGNLEVQVQGCSLAKKTEEKKCDMVSGVQASRSNDVNGQPRDDSDTINTCLDKHSTSRLNEPILSTNISKASRSNLNTNETYTKKSSEDCDDHKSSTCPDASLTEEISSVLQKDYPTDHVLSFLSSLPDSTSKDKVTKNYRHKNETPYSSLKSAESSPPSFSSLRDCVGDTNFRHDTTHVQVRDSSIVSFSKNNSGSYTTPSSSSLPSRYCECGSDYQLNGECSLTEGLSISMKAEVGREKPIQNANAVVSKTNKSKVVELTSMTSRPKKPKVSASCSFLAESTGVKMRSVLDTGSNTLVSKTSNKKIPETFLSEHYSMHSLCQYKPDCIKKQLTIIDQSNNDQESNYIKTQVFLSEQTSVHKNAFRKPNFYNSQEICKILVGKITDEHVSNNGFIIRVKSTAEKDENLSIENNANERSTKQCNEKRNNAKFQPKAPLLKMKNDCPSRRANNSSVTGQPPKSVARRSRSREPVGSELCSLPKQPLRRVVGKSPPTKPHKKLDNIELPCDNKHITTCCKGRSSHCSSNLNREPISISKAPNSDRNQYRPIDNNHQYHPKPHALNSGRDQCDPIPNTLNSDSSCCKSRSSHCSSNLNRKPIFITKAPNSDRNRCRHIDNNHQYHPKPHARNSGRDQCDPILNTLNSDRKQCEVIVRNQCQPIPETRFSKGNQCDPIIDVRKSCHCIMSLSGRSTSNREPIPIANAANSERNQIHPIDSNQNHLIPQSLYSDRDQCEIIPYTLNSDRNQCQFQYNSIPQSTYSKGNQCDPILKAPNLDRNQCDSMDRNQHNSIPQSTHSKGNQCDPILNAPNLDRNQCDFMDKNQYDLISHSLKSDRDQYDPIPYTHSDRSQCQFMNRKQYHPITQSTNLERNQCDPIFNAPNLGKNQYHPMPHSLNLDRHQCDAISNTTNSNRNQGHPMDWNQYHPMLHSLNSRDQCYPLPHSLNSDQSDPIPNTQDLDRNQYHSMDKDQGLPILHSTDPNRNQFHNTLNSDRNQFDPTTNQIPDYPQNSKIIAGNEYVPRIAEYNNIVLPSVHSSLPVLSSAPVPFLPSASHPPPASSPAAPAPPSTPYPPFTPSPPYPPSAISPPSIHYSPSTPFPPSAPSLPSTSYPTSAPFPPSAATPVRLDVLASSYDSPDERDTAKQLPYVSCYDHSVNNRIYGNQIENNKEKRKLNLENNSPAHYEYEDILISTEEYNLSNRPIETAPLIDNIYKSSKIGQAPTSFQNIQKIASETSDTSSSNVLEINLKFKLKQRDKTTEINIRKEKCNSDNVKANISNDNVNSNVYIINNSENNVKKTYPNHVNLNIVIKNPSQCKKVKRKKHVSNAAEVASKKHNNVSTEYLQGLQDAYVDTAVSVQQATIGVMPSSAWLKPLYCEKGLSPAVIPMSSKSLLATTSSIMKKIGEAGKTDYDFGTNVPICQADVMDESSDTPSLHLTHSTISLIHSSSTPKSILMSSKSGKSDNSDKLSKSEDTTDKTSKNGCEKEQSKAINKVYKIRKLISFTDTTDLSHIPELSFENTSSLSTENTTKTSDDRHTNIKTSNVQTDALAKTDDDDQIECDILEKSTGVDILSDEVAAKTFKERKDMLKQAFEDGLYLKNHNSKNRIQKIKNFVTSNSEAEPLRKYDSYHAQKSVKADSLKNNYVRSGVAQNGNYLLTSDQTKSVISTKPELKKSAHCYCKQFSENCDCCKRWGKFDKELDCDMSRYHALTALDGLSYWIPNVVSVHVQTVNSRYKGSSHGCNDNFKLTKNNLKGYSIGINNIQEEKRPYTKEYIEDQTKEPRNPNIKTHLSYTSKKLTKEVTQIEIPDQGEICYVKTDSTTITDRKRPKMHTKRARKVQNGADILQMYETKKAVLEIYAKKAISKEGEHFIARLPKFVHNAEGQLTRNFKKRQSILWNRDFVLMHIDR